MTRIVFNVGGDGLWSSVKGSVEILDMSLPYVNEDKDFGELCIYFNPIHWDVNIDGLINTDRQFMKDLQEFLHTHGLADFDVSYSEQGMQGDTYVSCDVGECFINTFMQNA